MFCCLCAQCQIAGRLKEHCCIGACLASAGLLALRTKFRTQYGIQVRISTKQIRISEIRNVFCLLKVQLDAHAKCHLIEHAKYLSNRVYLYYLIQDHFQLWYI